nr:hypothetical protein REQ54_02629 [Rhizobium sp. Q54]
MNDGKKKMNTACAWAAFLGSYLLVWLVISMPMERRSDDPAAPAAVIASLSAGN